MCTPYAQIAAVRTSATTPKPIVILRLWLITNDCRFSLSWQSDNCCERNYELPRTQTTVPSTLTHVPHPTTQISTLIVASAASGTARQWSFDVTGRFHVNHVTNRDPVRFRLYSLAIKLYQIFAIPA